MENRVDDRCAALLLQLSADDGDYSQQQQQQTQLPELGVNSSAATFQPLLLLPTITTKLSKFLSDLVSSGGSAGPTSFVNFSALLSFNYSGGGYNNSGGNLSIGSGGDSAISNSIAVALEPLQNTSSDGRFNCDGRNLAELATSAIGSATGNGASGDGFGAQLEVSKAFDGVGERGGGGGGAGHTVGIEIGDGAATQLLIDNWQDCVIVILFCLLIVVTVIGNTLVILSVITTRRLRTVTNCFVMSLAVADWLVGIFVMPPAVAVHLLGSWPLGWILCDIWISLDVLLCTASILSLCAISIDRYLAVTQPLNYSRRRRSKRLALLMILVVWVLALAITCPPILGWYEPGRRELTQCRYNQNEGYVVFSAMGSFFIPMAVMIYVYVRISCVVASRHDKMTEIEVHKKSHRARDVDEACYHYASEMDPAQLSPKRKRSSSQLSTGTTTYVTQLTGGGVGSSSFTALSGDCTGGDCPKLGGGTRKNHKNGHYELVDINSMSKPTTSFVGNGGGSVDVDDDNMPPGCHQQSPGATGGMKRNSTIHYKLASSTELWSSSNNVFNQQQKPQMANQSGGLRRTNTISNSITASTATGSASAVVAGRNIRIHQKSLSSRILSMKRENKTTQTLSIVVGGFIACWLPFFIHYIITPFLPNELAAPKLGEFFTWLGWINSAINPFIYAFYSVDFRAAFWRLTLRRFFRNSEKAPFANIHNMSMRR
ncbi:D(3) dopamine receptor-like [Armigeres subalbatus]|uniref:D(3) dopamine receptor-like n=1 Tax=Armigeres subalbatus TaxID=124917 RepID=UPI002ED3647D